MSQKTLKIKRVFTWTILNNLKGTPPKDFPTTGEIKSTITTIMPALKEHTTFYSDLMKKAEEHNQKLSSKAITDEESKVEIEKMNTELRDFNKEKGLEIVDVSLDDEGFKVLKAQFERDGWGKKWVVNIEEFGELMLAFDEASK